MDPLIESMYIFPIKPWEIFQPANVGLPDRLYQVFSPETTHPTPGPEAKANPTKTVQVTVSSDQAAEAMGLGK